MDIKYIINDFSNSYKKPRKRFSKTQTKILNEIFNYNKYPSTITRIKLAKKFNVSQRKIQIWFQNKRNKKN